MADSASTTGIEDEFTFESVVDKKYPLCPEGVQRVIVDKAVYEMRDNFQKTAKVPTINLMLSTLDAKYEDPATKKQMSYRLFKTLKISDHKKANMLDFFQKTCGTAVPLKEAKKEDGTVTKRIWLGRPSTEKGKDDKEEVRYKSFENMQFSVLVENKIPEGGTEPKDKIAAIVACTPEVKAEHAKLFIAA